MDFFEEKMKRQEQIGHSLDEYKKNIDEHNKDYEKKEESEGVQFGWDIEKMTQQIKAEKFLEISNKLVKSRTPEEKAFLEAVKKYPTKAMEAEDMRKEILKK